MILHELAHNIKMCNPTKHLHIALILSFHLVIKEARFFSAFFGLTKKMQQTNKQKQDSS